MPPNLANQPRPAPPPACHVYSAPRACAARAPLRPLTCATTEARQTTSPCSARLHNNSHSRPLTVRWGTLFREAQQTASACCAQWHTEAWPASPCPLTGSIFYCAVGFPPHTSSNASHSTNHTQHTHSCRQHFRHLLASGSTSPTLLSCKASQSLPMAMPLPLSCPPVPPGHLPPRHSCSHTHMQRPRPQQPLPCRPHLYSSCPLSPCNLVHLSLLVTRRLTGRAGGPGRMYRHQGTEKGVLGGLAGKQIAGTAVGEGIQVH